MEDEDFTKQDLLALATRIFGQCEKSWEHSWAYSAECKFKNRSIELTYRPQDRVVGISFFFLELPPGGASDDVFTTGRELQPGTLEGIRKFEEFAKELKKRGIGIEYETEGSRREELYKKVLQKAGFSAINPEASIETGDWRWR